MQIFPITTSSDRKTYSGVSVTFDASMAANEVCVFTASTMCYIAQHADTPVASAADGSVLIQAGESVMIWGALGAKLAVIRESADGAATLTKAAVLP